MLHASSMVRVRAVKCALQRPTFIACLKRASLSRTFVQSRHYDEPMTKEAIAQFEDGSHPSLQKPLSTRRTQKLKISEVQAPHQGVIRLITLNELKVGNALGNTLVDELVAEISQVQNEGIGGPTRALVIASEHDKIFCAGANLKERAGMTESEVDDFLAKLQGLFTSIDNLPIPVIAAVHGFALGGGLELALCAHLRVFGTSAVVGLPETRLAIVPGAGGTYRLPRAIGVSKSLDLILTARRIDAAEAFRIGLCHDLVTPAYETQKCSNDPSDSRARIAVREKAIHVAARIALGGPLAIRAAIQAIKTGSQEAENEAYRSVIKSEDRTEALRAFAEKRPPTFKGQ